MTAFLTLDRVEHRYGGLLGLREISLELASASSVALTGSNGSGKSTMLRIIAGLLAPLRGTARLWERDPHADRGVRRRVGYLGHELGLYDELTVKENLRFYAALYGIRNARAVSAALERFSILDRAASRVRDLSRGLKERAALARVSLHEPDLFLLDEPTTGLDRESLEVVWNWIRGERARGASVIFSTHERSLDDAPIDRVLRLS